MEEAGGYFFSQGTGRSEPGLDSPPDCQRLDRAKDSVGMHTAKFGRPKDLCYGALDYNGCEIQPTESSTGAYKRIPRVVWRAAVKQIL